MIFGQPRKITDPDRKAELLNNMIDSFYPGRSAILRPMSESDLKQTGVLSLPIEEASAKIREGGPLDEDEDYDLPIWAGTVPVKMQLMPPIPDPRNLDGVEMPEHVTSIKIG